MCFLNTFQFAMWAVPCQWDKLCCKFKSKYDHQVTCGVNFKPYGDNRIAKMKFIQDYQQLADGTYTTNRTNGCCAWIKRIWCKLWFFFWMTLFGPIYVIALLLAFIGYFISSMYQVSKGFILLYCCCNFLCLREYQYHGPRVKKVDNWSFMTFGVSEIERRRFDCYKIPVYLYSLFTQVYLRLCQYLSGLFTAKLISDDMIIYWVHLWSTTYSKFVYEYDPKTNQPLRIKGIIDDYSMWSSNESVAEFWEGTTFEILSVYIDYDDNCRIIFTLRNGEKIIEPRFGDNSNIKWDGDISRLSDEQLDEIRVWNIVKAHYQCLISIYPALIHTWTHFHFNDLTLKYIEKYWNDNLFDDDCKQGLKECHQHTVMNRLIRSHTYYTSALNAAGQKSGFANPQMDEWNLCEFIFAPWKVLPANTEIIRRHFIEDTTKHYFTDIEQDININSPGNMYQEYDRFKCLMANDSDDDSVELMVHSPDSGDIGSPKSLISVKSGSVRKDKEKHVSFKNFPPKPSLKAQKSDRSYLSKHSHHFDLKFKPSYNSGQRIHAKPNMMKCKTNSASTTEEYTTTISSSNGRGGVIYQPKMIKVQTDSSTYSHNNNGYSPYNSPSLNPVNEVENDTPLSRIGGMQSKFNITPHTNPISTPTMLMQQMNAHNLKYGSRSGLVDSPSILLVNEFSLNADITEEEVNQVMQKTHSASNTMIFNVQANHLSHFIDPTHNVPNTIIPHDIEVTTSIPSDGDGESQHNEMKRMDESPQIEEKTANPNAFPPIFVRNRLDMFHLEFPTGNKWIEMHRGYSIYKDYLADYYRVIHEEFVLKLYRNNFINDQDLKTWVIFLENEGYPGITQCKRNGTYLHILSTFLWLNIAHASDHTIANNIIRDFGIGASYVRFNKLKWYKENKKYNFVDVLEGKSIFSKWRLQFYAMKNRLFWYAFGAPQDNACLVADYFIDSNLYRKFIDVDNISHKERKDLNKIHKQFIKQMKSLDICYGWLMPINEVTAGVSY